MAVHFHSLRINKVHRETPDCISVSFDIPSSLEESFRFSEGQNITVKKLINGEELRRSYSICSAPHESELKIAIKKVEGGRFSSYANESLKAGDELEVLPPGGKFNAHLSTSTHPSYLAIAAGSGITPVLSIIKHTLKTQPNSRFTLLFGNRNLSSVIFFDELQNIKDTHLGRFNLINILSRERMDTEIHFGRIDETKLKALQSFVPYTNFDAIYLCGPEELIFTSKKFLEAAGVSSDKIHFELFTVPGQQNATRQIKKTEENKNTGPQSLVEIKLDGRSFEMNLAYNGASILDAALQNGADLPYACKGGVCSTCRARLVEGKVEMEHNYALEPEEVEQGFILTCQSHPRTERIKVDFDVS